MSVRSKIGSLLFDKCNLFQKIRQLEQMLERRRSVSEMSDKMAAEQEEEECESASESESTGSETRAMRRRRKLPSHISLQQEEVCGILRQITFLKQNISIIERALQHCGILPCILF